MQITKSRSAAKLKTQEIQANSMYEIVRGAMKQCKREKF